MKTPLVRAICWIQVYVMAITPALYATTEESRSAPPSSTQSSDQEYRNAREDLARKIEELRAADRANPATDSAMNSLELAINELEKSEEGQLPSRPFKDKLYLTGQSLADLKTGKTYNLSEINFQAPVFKAANFDKDVQPAIDPVTGSLCLELSRKGEVIARHSIQIPNFSPISFYRDREVLIALDKTGKRVALDMAYAFYQGFRSPLPMIEMSKVDLQGTQNAEIKLLNRGIKPIEGQDNERVFKAGDVVVTDSANRLLSEPESLSDLKMMITEIEGAVALVAFNLNPGLVPKKVAESISSLMGNPTLGALQTDVLQQMSALERDAFLAIPGTAVQKLVSRSKINAVGSARTPDEFSLEEWRESFNKYQAQARHQLGDAKRKLTDEKRALLFEGLEGEDFSKVYRDLENDRIEDITPKQAIIYRILNSKAMRTLGYVTAVGATAWATDHFAFGGQAAAWSVHMLNEFLHAHFEVLTDATYRVTLFKSSVALLSLIGLYYGVGALTSKYLNQPWSAVKGVCAFSFRVYGALMVPFFHILAKAARQPNLMKTWQQGVPLGTRIDPSSEIGRKAEITETVRLGVNNPFSFGKNREQALTQNLKALEAVAKESTSLRSVAWTISLIAASQEAGIDPVTLETLLREGVSAKNLPDLQERLKNPEFRKNWYRTANELQFRLKKIQMDRGLDFEKLKPVDIAGFYSEAFLLAREIRNDSRFDSNVRDLNILWKNFGALSRSGFANFGIEEYNFLRFAEPGDFVVGQGAKQFITDYFLGVLQMGLIGARADLRDPSALAAREGSFLYTNPGHFADMGDQVRIYALNAPARMGLVYQNELPIIENRYDPIEQIVLQPQKTSDGKIKSESLVKEEKEAFTPAAMTWGKGVSNFKETNLGNIWIKSLLRTVKTVQVSFVMIIGARMLMAHQDFSDATLAFIYTMIWANWQFGWLWDPITRGNQIYGEKFEEPAAKFAEAKINLGRALRASDREATLEAYRNLRELYRSVDVSAPASIDNLLSDDNFKKLEAALTQIDANSVNQSIKASSELRWAILSGDPAKIEQAREKLLEVYKQSNAAEDLLRLDATTLLAHSLKKPPFATVGNSLIEWMTTMFGAVLTTYWATSLSVLTFSENVPWGEKILEATAVSAFLYGGFYGLQKFINSRVWTKEGREKELNETNFQQIKISADGKWTCAKVARAVTAFAH
ncbi:MAG: hypothetical protein J0L93_05950 [Deltaproteobacteria bacterium]|nr:hypothetical protein [Deltaproteobacteria bacterium]